MAKEFDVSAIFRVIDKASGPMKKISMSMASMTKPITAVNNSFNKLGVAIKKVGFKGFKAKLASSLAPLKQYGKMMAAAFPVIAIKKAMDFNKQMANVATLIPKNTKRIKELREGTQEMAMDLGISTTDLSSGLYQVVSAFGDTDESMAQLKVSARAAKAGLATTTESINLLSAITKGYGDVTEDAMKKAANLSFMTVKLGKTSFPELASSMGRVVPFAAKLKVSQKELFASFATLTGVTGNTSEVSTQMAAVLKAMLKPTTAMSTAAKDLGYESSVQMLKQEGLIGSLRKLKTITKGNEQATGKLFGRAEALTAVFALTGNQTEDYDKKLKALQNSTGAMDTAFKEQTEGVNKAGHAWNKLKVSLEVATQEIGEALLPVIEILGGLVSAFRSLPGPIKKFIIILGVLGVAILIATKVVMAFGVAFSVAIWPITLIVAAIAALIAIVYTIYEYWGPISEFFVMIWDTVKEVFWGFISWFKEAWTSIGDWFGELWEGIVDTVLGWWDKIVGIWDSVKEFFSSDSKKDININKNVSGALQNKSETDVKIKVMTDKDSTASIEGVKKKGSAKVKIATPLRTVG